MQKESSVILRIWIDFQFVILWSVPRVTFIYAISSFLPNE